jgi:hypothetical protein
MPIPIYYHFRQRFNVSARKAYEWCTDYAPGDHALMGEKDTSRQIERLTERTVILTDTLSAGTRNQTEKQRLVQLYPETLFWTSAHINGPAKHSQFIYQITVESDLPCPSRQTGIALPAARHFLSRPGNSNAWRAPWTRVS